MVADTNQDDLRPQPPALKVIEPRVNLVTPWTDDKLTIVRRSRIV